MSPKPFALFALEGCNDAFGDEDAVFDPDGVAAPVVVTWAMAEGEGTFLQGRRVISEDGRAATVNRYGTGGLETVSDSDVFEIGGARWQVIGDPVHPEDDPDGLIWRFALAEIAP